MTTNDAAERLPTAFVRFKANMTPENVREFRETWDQALAAAKQAGYNEAQGFAEVRIEEMRRAIAPLRAALRGLVEAWDAWDGENTPEKQDFLAALAAARRLVKP